MIGLPPYALAPLTFRFRALVALAERLPVGGEREVVLATFVTARLLWDWTDGSGLPAAGLSARAQGARQWLQSLSLPSPVRGMFQSVTEAMSAGNRAAAATAWERALAHTSKAVDGAARGDFRELAARLTQPVNPGEGVETTSATEASHA